ncbi:uncharacterized protein LOC108888638 [Lates calcarifer]|uniref:Uncharacterized protein LOC108888638 n=1 Tax=Lates calcarifer TaxID=8187 RepID=A0AAJ7PW42_LATCA|nr:uncharacterized protein LOC108888638 [Lates calcarifer]XP_018540225.1 uncharacterized protein LOC108888638 [Lates calcarifer]XP_018540226.1 uncharacterized protein LOC108888638 [Lates calcarifer]
MSVLMGEIRHFSTEAVHVLRQEGLTTDSDIRSLTREDLRELFPGKPFKFRREIYTIIHKQRPINDLLEGLKGFLTQECLSAALTDNGVLVEYFHVLKSVKNQLDDVQTFLDAHIDLLENISKKNQANPKPEGVLVPIPSPKGFHEVKYKMVIKGTTFGAHEQLMDQVKKHSQDEVHFTKSSEDHQIIIVFCPITSRVGTDADAALADEKVFTDNKPVILVLMHHSHEVKHTTSMRTWTSKANVVLNVNVFYHETKHGLLRCEQNDMAVADIRQELLKHRRQRSNDASVGTVDESGGSGNASTAQGGNTGNEGILSRFWTNRMMYK